VAHKKPTHLTLFDGHAYLLSFDCSLFDASLDFIRLLILRIRKQTEDVIFLIYVFHKYYKYYLSFRSIFVK